MEKSNELDALIQRIAAKAESENNRTQIVNPKRVTEFLDAYKELSTVAKALKLSIDYKLHEPYMSMGVISITGKSFKIKNTEFWDLTKTFSEAANTASNIDIYPMSNGQIKVDITFHGLTVAAKED